MSYFFPNLRRPFEDRGAEVRDFASAHAAEDDHAADAELLIATRTNAARSMTIARPSFSYRAHRPRSAGPGRARRNNNVHAYANRRAPPGRDPRCRRQGEPDRGV